MSLFASLQNGVSGLNAASSGLNTTAHNLANTKTAGYTRQQTIQKDMYDRAKAFLDSHIDFAETMDEMNEKFNTKRGFIKAKWCLSLIHI